MATKVVDSQLLPEPIFELLSVTAKATSAERLCTGATVQSLLLWDEVVLPTHNYEVLSHLIHWFGIERVLRLLDEESLSFLRRDHRVGPASLDSWWLCLAESRGALLPRPLDPPLEAVLTQANADLSLKGWEAEAAFCDPAKALELQLTHVDQPLPLSQRSNLLKRIIERTVTFDAGFRDKFLEPLIMAVLSDPDLRPYFVDPGFDDGLTKKVDDEHKSRFRQILRPLSELAWSNLVSATDLVSHDRFYQMIRAKVEPKPVWRAETVDAFRALREIESIPDIPQAVASGANASDILDLRNSKEGRKFRLWLAQNVASASPDEIKRRYVELLAYKPGMPTKAIRFLVTSLLGAAHPLWGLVSGGLDTAVGDRIGEPYMPRLFLDRLRESIPTPSKGILGLR